MEKKFIGSYPRGAVLVYPRGVHARITQVRISPRSSITVMRGLSITVYVAPTYSYSTAENFPKRDSQERMRVAEPNAYP